jgi:hypothetical protein
MTSEDQVAKEITRAKRRGFKPGDSYRRDDDALMVEITPGNFVNEATARRFGVKARGGDR